MKNKIIYQLKSKIKISISGKNINRFIMKLYKNKIEILKCNYINKEKANIIIYAKDYEKVNKIKTIYNIEKLNIYGIIKIKRKINTSSYLIISLIIGYIILRILTRMIFKIEIITNDQQTREFLKKELNKKGIKEKTFKKNYHKIEKIKTDILEKYKDKIEWIEIETKGTKYIVRLEQRIKKEETEKLPNRNIISKKDAIIKKVIAEEGQILKEPETYVKKGETIISGTIYENEVKKNQVPARGIVYGETWYEIDLIYPYIYKETKELNNKKTVYTVKILNKNIELFNKNPFKTKKIKEKILVKNSILPIALTKQTQIETQEIEEILTVDEAIKKAEIKAIEKMKNNLKENEYIIANKILNTNIKENQLELKMFFSIYENITDYQIIE
jgi:similar to stage IV sporulation protein